MLRKFAFAKLIVGDLAALEAFYGEAFGMRVVTRITVDAPGWELDETILAPAEDDGATLNLVRYRDRPRPAPGEAVLGFEVTGIEAVIARAVAAGGTIATPLTDVPEHRLRLAYVVDPDGHLIELIEPLASAG